jgi:hypothetical protein
MPTIRSEDFARSAGVLPEDTPVKVTEGSLHGSLDLKMDDKYWARGKLVTAIDDLKMEAAGVRVGGNLKLQTPLALNPKLGTYRPKIWASPSASST